MIKRAVVAKAEFRFAFGWLVFREERDGIVALNGEVVIIQVQKDFRLGKRHSGGNCEHYQKEKSLHTQGVSGGNREPYTDFCAAWNSQKMQRFSF
jgi:hypothetical protein